MIKKMEATKWCTLLTPLATRACGMLDSVGKYCVCVWNAWLVPKKQSHKTERKKQWKMSMCWCMCLQLSPSLSSSVVLQWTNNPNIHAFKKEQKRNRKSSVLHYALLSKVLLREGQPKQITTQLAPLSLFYLLFQLLLCLMQQFYLLNLLTIIIIVSHSILKS